ncbi:hypothetical protein FPQ18DRAFT_380568 [Pyronema domesticum]|nr:hypothetical protein FPQ18DRAFT_380568 [Pyronema domesticum]
MRSTDLILLRPSTSASEFGRQTDPHSSSFSNPKRYKKKTSRNRTRKRAEIDIQKLELLGAIQGEKVRQAVQAFDPKSTGFIEVANFQRIVQETAGHKLSDHILDNLSIFISVGVASKIPCANVRAFQTVVREMDTIDTIVKECNRQIQG